MFEAGRLSLIQCFVAFRIIPHQNLTEGGAKSFDVCGKILAILEIKLVLSTFFGWTRGYVTLRRRMVEDRCAELLIYQNARLLFLYTGGNRGLKTLIDHLLSGSNFSCLLRSQFALPAEHLRLERAAVIKGLNVQRFVEPHAHNFLLLSW